MDNAIAWNIISSLGAFLLGASTLPFIANIVGSWLYGPRAVDNPWHATGLEWTTSSPPPPDNFEVIPVVKRPPYDYGDPKYSIVEPIDNDDSTGGTTESEQGRS